MQWQNISKRPILCKGEIYAKNLYAKTNNMRGENICKDLSYARGKYMQRPIICKGEIYAKPMQRPIICKGKIYAKTYNIQG